MKKAFPSPMDPLGAGVYNTPSWRRRTPWDLLPGVSWFATCDVFRAGGRLLTKPLVTTGVSGLVLWLQASNANIGGFEDDSDNVSEHIGIRKPGVAGMDLTGMTVPSLSHQTRTLVLSDWTSVP